jgi:hypothetical protein
MSQVILELSDKNDLELLLAFAKRLDVRIISVKNIKKERKMSLMREIVKDPIFLEDMAQLANDFVHVDKEGL